MYASGGPICRARRRHLIPCLARRSSTGSIGRGMNECIPGQIDRCLNALSPDRQSLVPDATNTRVRLVSWITRERQSIPSLLILIVKPFLPVEHSEILTLVYQDTRMPLHSSKRKTRVPASFRRERLVQEFSVSHNEAPRRDKSPGDHVPRYMAFWGIWSSNRRCRYATSLHLHRSYPAGSV